MHVLVTGCTGYIGSVLTHQLLGKGLLLRGYDALLFGGIRCSTSSHPRQFVRGDATRRRPRSAPRGRRGPSRGDRGRSACITALSPVVSKPPGTARALQ
jgi:nucleoside-diphosphate-sugar epimerase